MVIWKYKCDFFNLFYFLLFILIDEFGEMKYLIE